MSAQQKLKKIYIKMLRAFSKKKMKKGNKHRQRIIEIEAMNKNFNGKSYVKDGIESDF